MLKKKLDSPHYATFLVAIFIGALLVIVGLTGFGTGPTKAKSSSIPEWTGIAGNANHLCYNHYGVASISWVAGSYYQINFVCKDGWVVYDYIDHNGN